MEQDLVGYLLNALDDRAHRDVEEYLEKNPSAKDRLESLKKPLAMLALDAEAPQPPAGLAERTLAYVMQSSRLHNTGAGETAEPLLSEPTPEEPPRAKVLSFPLAFMARADVLVAACLLVAALGVGTSWLFHINEIHRREACKHNLATLYIEGLDPYRAKNGHFPNVHTVAAPPRNVAGLVVPSLIEQGYLDDDFAIICPGGNKVTPIKYDEAMKMSLEKFQKEAEKFTPGLGYSLGFRDKDGKIYGPDGKLLDAGSAFIILMADSPPKNPLVNINSPNHHGAGQNVLFSDGHSEFKTSRKIGYKNDDIYLNTMNKVEAGTEPHDSVIGFGWSKP